MLQNKLSPPAYAILQNGEFLISSKPSNQHKSVIFVRMEPNLIDHIFDIRNEADFLRRALDVFAYQYHNIESYRKFCNLTGTNPELVDSLEKIPFLPIQFFKSQHIIPKLITPDSIFTSSGTTGQVTSKHYVADLKIYEKAFLKIFKQFYGNPEDYVILALLPSYLEREGSSLIYMVEKLIDASGKTESDFYLHNLDELATKIKHLESQKRKSLLIGVSYALLDLIEKHQFKLRNTIVMETGGMKGKRKEMIKEELHAILKNGFGTSKIHSEYGMTELLSQAYSTGEGVFKTPSWMKILTRDSEDALSYVVGRTGGINVIDLANIYSCSFIATQDLGTVYPDGSFEVKGRFDNSDIRGCNLMVL